ncbi:MAG TPA: hypothetical protein VG722_06215, partial [Tepidisphaeraceae bacterium]|nr:hypothetical protein [Tepidisphaeraceae bacterium]
IALAHGADGILYFSYWPQAPQTWASISTLDKDIERIMPWLVAVGEEVKTTSDMPLDLRTKKVGDGYLIIAVNHEPKPCNATIRVPGLANEQFRLPFEARTLSSTSGTLHDHFDPFSEHVYLTGPEPATTLISTPEH